MGFDKDFLRDFTKGTARIDEQLLQEWIGRIQTDQDPKRGDAIHGIARAIIRDFCMRQWLGQPQSQATLNWLAEVLDSIVDYEAEPLDALGLMPRPKKRPANPQAAIDVAIWIELAVESGLTTGEAIAQAANVFHKGTRQIERLRQQGGAWASPPNPGFDWRQYFLRLQRPLPGSE